MEFEKWKRVAELSRSIPYSLALRSVYGELRCGMCCDREQGQHGEVREEWSSTMNMMVTACRKHSFETEAA